MTNTKNLEEILNSFNIETNPIQNDEKISVWKNWKKHFLPDKYFLDNHKTEWHTFSFNLIPHKHGKLAIDAFQDQYVKRFYIHSSNPKILSLYCVGCEMPPFAVIEQFLRLNTLFYDLYFHHHKFNWTFVITHENDFGPYFCDNPLLK